jgi:hypothetical protein
MARPLLAAVIMAWAPAVGLPALGQPTNRPGSAAAGSTHEIVDVTHTLGREFRVIPVPGITFPFGLEAIATIPQHGVAANRWTIHEHLRTQIDAPRKTCRVESARKLVGYVIIALALQLVGSTMGAEPSDGCAGKPHHRGWGIASMARAAARWARFS